MDLCGLPSVPVLIIRTIDIKQWLGSFYYTKALCVDYIGAQHESGNPSLEKGARIIKYAQWSASP